MHDENVLETNSAVPERRAKYFAAIIVCIVLLYVFNNLLSIFFLSVPPGSNIFRAIMDSQFVQVNIPFLSSDFVNCLWGINLALILGMMGNFALLFYHPRWFNYLLQAVLIATGILPVYLVYKVFPFTIDSQSLPTLTKNGLIAFMSLLSLVVIFMLIKSAVNFVRTIRNFERL